MIRVVWCFCLNWSLDQTLHNVSQVSGVLHKKSESDLSDQRQPDLQIHPYRTPGLKSDPSGINTNESLINIRKPFYKNAFDNFVSITTIISISMFIYSYFLLFFDNHLDKYKLILHQEM